MTSPNIGTLEVEVRANFDRLVQQIETRLQAINKAQMIKLRVKLQEKTLDNLNKQLKSYTGINALTNEFQKAGNQIRGVFDNIGGLSRKLVILGGLLGPLTVGIGALSLAIVALGTGAAGALAAAPGLFAGLAASVFVFKTAMADAGTVLKDSLKPFGEIKKIISENFWAEAQGGAELFLNSAIGPLKEGFGLLSTAAGSFTSHLAGSLSRAFTPDVYAKFFGGLTSAFDILAKHGFTDALANILAKLAVFAADLFPRIAQGIADITVKFDAFLTKNPDFLINAWGTFVDIIKGFVAVAVGLFGIFQGIATAASAAGIGAGSFGEALKGIADKIKGPEFQGKLTAFFLDAKAGMSGLGEALGPLGSLFGSLAPIIGDFIRNSGQALGTFFGELFTAMNKPEVIGNIRKAFEVLPKVFENLTPVVGTLADDFGELLAFGATLADEFSKNLAAAIEALSPVISAILPSVEKLTKALGEFFRTKIKDLAPQFEAVGQAVKGLIDGVTMFVEALDTPVLKFIIGLITDFISTAIQGFANLAGGVLKVVAGLAQVLSGDFSGFAQIWDGIKSMIEGTFQLFITLFAPAKILGLVGRLFPAIGRLVTSGVTSVVGLIARGLEAIPGLGVALMRSLLERITGGAVAVGGAIISGIVRGAQALIGGFLVQVYDWIVGGVKSILGIASPSTVFAEIGGFLIQGLIQGVQALIGALVDIFMVPIEAIKLIFTTAFDFILVVGQLLWDGLSLYFNAWMAVITTGIAIVQAVVNAAWEVIKAAGMLLWDILKAAFEGWMVIISAGIIVVQAVVGAVWEAIKVAGELLWAVLSLAFEGWKLLISAGIAVVQAVVTAVWDTLKAAGELLWTVLTAAFNTWKALIEAGIAVVQAVVSAVWDALKKAGELLWTVLTNAFEGWKRITEAGIAVVKAVVTAVWDALKAAGELLWKVLTNVFNTWKGIVEAGIAVVKAVITAVWDALKAAGELLWTVLTNAFNTWKGIIEAGIAVVKAVITAVWDALKAAGSLLWDVLKQSFQGWKSIIESGIAAVKAVVDAVWNALKAAGSAVWTTIQNVFNGFKSAIEGGINALRGVIAGVWSAIQSAGSAIWAPISSAFNSMKGAISGGVSALQGAVTGAWNNIKSVGSGIWSGITGAFNSAKSALTGGVSAIKSAFTGAFEAIKSKVLAVFNTIKNSIPKISIPGLSKLPGFAGGVTNFRGGLAIVGERGPELVALPPGSDVFTNQKSKDMLRRRAAENTPTLLPAAAPAAPDPGRWDDVIAELRSLKKEVAATNDKYLVLSRQGAI